MPISRSGRGVAAAFVIIFGALPLLLLHYRGSEAQSDPRRGAAPAANTSPSRSAADGLGRAAGLLPLARRLTLEALEEVAGRYGVGEAALRGARRQVEAVRDVRLVTGLGDLAEFDEDEPTEVRVGEEYARNLTNDDEAVLLLAHELTHAAAVGNGLDELIEAVAADAARRSGIFAADEQKEDLLCEYVGEQALKRFARLSPGREPLSVRVGRAFGGVGREDEGEGDEEHLSPGETWRALRGLDPELE